MKPHRLVCLAKEAVSPSTMRELLSPRADRLLTVQDFELLEKLIKFLGV